MKLDGVAGPLSRADSHPSPIRTQAHLDEIARTVAKGAHAVLLLDRAGWHNTAKLVVPKNISLIFLTSRSSKLNPVENIWQYLRANWLSNRVFDTYDNIIDAACDAWNRLVDQPKTITSIGRREWAHIGQECGPLVLFRKNCGHSQIGSAFLRSAGHSRSPIFTWEATSFAAASESSPARPISSSDSALKSSVAR